MIKSLISNITLLISLSICYSFILRKFRKNIITSDIIIGTGIGIITIAGMLNPLVYQPGLIFDGRSIIISIAGLYTGLIPTLIATLICSSYRIYLGGVGAIIGVLVTISSALIGLLFNRVYLPRTKPQCLNILEHFLFGIFVHIVMILWMFILPDGRNVVKTIFFPVICLFPLGTTLLGTLIRDQLLRYKAENDLIFSEKKYRPIFEDSLTPMLIIDPSDSSIFDANKSAIDFYGYQKEELTSKKIFDINTLPQDETRKQMIKALEHKQFFFNFKHKLSNNDIKDVEVYSNVIMIDNKEYFLSIVHDVTEKNKLKEQLIHSEKLASIGEMAAIAAHEFNNILSIISAINQMMDVLSNENDINKDNFKTIEKQISNARQIINNIKKFAAVSKQEFSKCKMNEIIDEIIMLEKLFCDKAKIKITKNLINDCFVNINKGQIQQVFMNLFNNSRYALKDIKNPEIFIELNVKANYQTILFRDNGSGISYQIKDKIFSSFFTTKNLETNGAEGSGLGLSVSQTIIRGHGGTIEILDTDKTGVSFFIKLPMISE